MKDPIAPLALGTLSVLLPAGRAGGAAVEAPASAKARIKAPSPNAEQAASLVAELTKGVPALEARDADRGSETTCRFILINRSEDARVRITRSTLADATPRRCRTRTRSGSSRSSGPTASAPRPADVLSAKHGLIHPDTVIEPCDMRLGTNDRTSPPIHTWAAGVRDQLAVELASHEGATLVALAGEQYRTVLLHSARPYEVPMKGLGIGQQIGWLTARLNADSH